jgi:hypothetical protein
LTTLFDRSEPGPESEQLRAEIAADRHADIIYALRDGKVIPSAAKRLAEARDGRAPWISTLTPAELLIARSHGITPIATVSATCWLQCDFSPTEGHMEGWDMALRRLGEEAKAAGANAVLDVKMRTIPLSIKNCMDFTLVGTAAKVKGLSPSVDPIIATVPALEFVKLLEADIVPTGIAVGANCQWLSDTLKLTDFAWLGAIDFECAPLSGVLKEAQKQAQDVLRNKARNMGTGVLAHVHRSDVFEVEPECVTDAAAEPMSKLRAWPGRIARGFTEEEEPPPLFLARYIVVATTVDVPQALNGLPHDFQFVVDLRAGKTPLKGNNTKHHQSYALNDQEGAI